MALPLTPAQPTTARLRCFAISLAATRPRAVPPPYSQLSIGGPAQAASMLALTRHHRRCALTHALSRRSQLSVGFTSGSMLHDRTLAAAAAPLGVVRLRRPQLCDVSRKRRQRTDRPRIFTRGGAPSHRAPEGRAAAGAWEFRPRSCVRSAGGGCPRTSPPLGSSGGFHRVLGRFPPSTMFHVCGRRARSRSARPSPFSLSAGGIRRHVSAVRVRPRLVASYATPL